MSNREPLVVEFPADGDYIPSVRKFIAESSMIEGFTQKFAYRTEIIIDELCNNAVKFGPSRPDAMVRLQCDFDNDGIQLNVQDAGGAAADVEKLKGAVAASQSKFMGRGLEIVKMLSNHMEFTTRPTGETVVRVIKQRSHDQLEPIMGQ